MILNPDDKPACADPVYNPDAWFPDPPERNIKKYDNVIKEQILLAVEALEVCSTCPIQKQCLDLAFTATDSIDWGIYGGTLPFERRIAAGLANNVAHLGHKYQRRIREIARTRGVRMPKIGKREKAKSWLTDQPNLHKEFIQRGWQ